jgi:hypothetical protein
MGAVEFVQLLLAVHPEGMPRPGPGTGQGYRELLDKQMYIGRRH